MDSINKTNYKIFEELENISDAIFQSSNPSFLHEFHRLNEVGKLLKLNNLQTAIVSMIATKGPNLQVITEANLIQTLSKFKLTRSEIILTIKQLRRSHVITIHDTHSHEELEISRKYSRFLETDNFEGIHELQSPGVLALLKRVMTSIMGSERHALRRHFMASEFDDESSFEEDLLLEVNESLTIIKYADKKIKEFGWDHYATQLFFFVLAKKVLMDDSTEIDPFMIQKDISQWERKAFIHDEIISGKWPPLKDGYFELVGNQQLNDEIELEVTDEGIQQLLPELDAQVLHSLLHCKTVTVPHIDPEKILPIPLIYDKNTQKNIQPLKQSLQPEIRKKIQEKLGKKKLGLTALFYGFPGTGKTELCYQLAKEFQLPIYEVNVAQIQNKWVGESEKNARKVFQQFAKLKKQIGKECILFFNEADALLGKRINVNSSVDSMNNAIKNIFLEEIERFDGILIATTNLTENMDLAFERRFLFKIFFDRPEIETAAKIWKQYFQGITLAESFELAKKFNFSPGEINNVHTRFEIEKILGNRTAKIKLIEQLCQEERIKTHSNRSTKSMGFG